MFSKENALISRWRAFQSTKPYDFMAAVPLIAWYSLSLANVGQQLQHEIANAASQNWSIQFTVTIVAHASVVAFIGLAIVLLVLRQPPKAKSKGLLPRVFALAGSYLLVSVVWLEHKPSGVFLTTLSLLFTVGGMLVAVFALAHLGRSFSVMPEARGLVTNGPYAIVRHPLYLGEAISTVGLLLQYLSPLGVALVVLQLCYQLQRIKNEELVLGALFPEYEAYRMKTFRLVPGVY